MTDTRPRSDEPIGGASAPGASAPGASASSASASASREAPRKRERTPVWLVLVVIVGAAPAVFALYILFFIARYSILHDERRCPYEHVETREVAAGVRVREERRRCIEEVEEHRWLVVRGTAPADELGRYPLEAELIPRGFPWRAELEEGRVVVTVMNEGRGELVLREPRPDER